MKYSEELVNRLKIEHYTRDCKRMEGGECMCFEISVESVIHNDLRNVCDFALPVITAASAIIVLLKILSNNRDIVIGSYRIPGCILVRRHL